MNMAPLKIVFDIDRYFPDELQEVGDSGRATFEEKRPLYLAAGRHFLNNYGAMIRERHDEGADGEWVVRSISDMMDTLIRKLFLSITCDLKRMSGAKEQIALVAIGGYGRGELNPHSDIDLMFLYGGSECRFVENIAQKILYFLWDMRLDVGYSVRTVNDCIEMAEADATVKTALLDIRHVCGNRPLYKELMQVVLTRIMPRGSDAFIRQKVADLNARREKYGSSVYLLEPNIKEGEGGLRDLHSALWIAKVRFKVTDPRELVQKGVVSEEELVLYNSLLSYLWRIRNHLHYVTGRRNDQLTFADQNSVAMFFGYRDNAGILGVEEFLRDYYLHATRVEQFWSLMVSRCRDNDEPRRKLGYLVRRHVGEGFCIVRGELTIADETILAKDPATLMKLFEYAQKHGVGISMQARDLVRKNLSLVNDRFRRNRDVNGSFFAILNSPKGVVETLRLMHYLGLLIRFIPEFERVYCKAQHDLYHIYTVDVHSLFAVEEIIKLWSGAHRETHPLLTRLADEVGT